MRSTPDQTSTRASRQLGAVTLVSSSGNFDVPFLTERSYASVSEDALNFYTHGVPASRFPGISANYTVLPKYAWFLKETA